MPWILPGQQGGLIPIAGAVRALVVVGPAFLTLSIRIAHSSIKTIVDNTLNDIGWQGAASNRRGPRGRQFHGPGCRGGRCRSGPCARRDPIPVADVCAVTLWRGIGATAAGRTLAPTSAVCAGSAAELKFDGTHLLPELYCSR